MSMEIEIDGIKLNYEQHGAGENVLVLHGWGASIETMRPIIDALKDRYRITALDFPASAKAAPPDSFGVPEYTRLPGCFLNVWASPKRTSSAIRSAAA